MPEYMQSDLVVKNSIDVIRSKPHLYSGGTPVAVYWIRDLVRDLLLLEIGSIDIKKFDGWWRIYSEKDWMENDGAISIEPFSKIIHLPSAGREAMRTEVVIAALSKALFTIGRDGINWIAGNSNDFVLPNNLATEVKEYESGRMIAFLVQD